MIIEWIKCGYFTVINCLESKKKKISANLHDSLVKKIKKPTSAHTWVITGDQQESVA